MAAGESIIREKASEMSKHLASGFLDSLFLAAWAVPNYYIGHFVDRLQLVGVDAIVLRCLQVLFGISTLAPIVIWIYKDIFIMAKRANRDIRAVDVPQMQQLPPEVVVVEVEELNDRSQ
jgi:hypothetical protein